MKRKAIGTFLVIVMVLGCSFSALAYTDPHTSGTIPEVTAGTTLNDNSWYGVVTTNNGTIVKNWSNGTVTLNNGTVENNNIGGIVTTNNGTVVKNYAAGTVTTNAGNGTIETNEGDVTTNNGTIGDALDETSGNYGTVTENAGTVWFNQDGGKITTNKGTVDVNIGTIVTNAAGATVTRNEGTIDTNAAGGIVTLNNKTVTENVGVVGLNALTGEVTLGIEQVRSESYCGRVDINYGTVEKATILSSGKLTYGVSGKTYYGVTYGENADVVTVYSNEQRDSEDATSYTVLTAAEAGANKEGYRFVSWKANTSDGSTDSTAYVGGETYAITMPVWFEAIWEVIQQAGPQKEAEAEEEQRASFTGTTDNAVSGGRWNTAPDGSWSYNANGAFKDTWGYITLADGRTGWFWFDGYGIMATGWKTIGGKMYYFNEAHDGTYGMMLADTTTPDGYRVGADGARIQ